MLSPHGRPTIGGAFLFWIVFLLALEPGNVMHASSMGHSLDFGDEALRICAALLGCSTAPLILVLSRRFPISGTRGWRTIAIHSVGAAAVSLMVVVVSCVLAAWVLMGEIVPTAAEVRSQLAGNWLLVTFGLCTFGAISHAVKIRYPQPSPPTRVPIKTRGRLGSRRYRQHRVDRSQGNYLALHVDGRSHLFARRSRVSTAGSTPTGSSAFTGA